jgi:signal transduction histidine kinase
VVGPDYVAPIYLRANSGHYFIIKSREYRLTSRSLGEADLDMGPEDLPPKTLVHRPGPDGQKLLVWVGHYEKNGHPVGLLVAEELTMFDRHLRAFRLRFGGMTLVLLSLLIVAQRLVVNISMKPLARMGAACRKLESGAIDAIPENVPAELQPLAGEINRLVRLMRQRLVRSRNALGNLAHALKTPLAVLSQIVQNHGDRLEPELRQQAETSVARIQSIIDRELKRARLAGPTSAGQISELGNDVRDIVGLLKKVYADKELAYELRFEPETIRYGDREDMMELFGNLLDNASKWARQRVRLSVVLGECFDISVEDDGPGIPDDVQDDLTRRGVRFDERKAGHGLGLSIIKDIVTQYDGATSFSKSPGLGGLRVQIRLSAATNCRETD